MKPPSMDSPLVYIGFVISPALGYIPQLLARDILLSPLVSAFFMMSNILKIFHYSFERYSEFLLAQHAFVVLLHICLVAMSRRPLGKYEAKVFGNRMTRLLYRGYGVKGSVLGVVCAFVLCVNLCGVLYGSYEYCGKLSSALEIGINLFQLVLEREERASSSGKNDSRRSPKEVYLCWVVGDVIKIWLMSSVNAPIIFMGTIVVQIVIDVFLILS